MRPKLKICGLMREEDVTMCCGLGVDICGFVVEYPVAVPWNLTREQCAALLTSISADSKSCIVTGGEREEILALVLELKPDYVQLHYHETLADTAFLVRALEPYGIGVIKTLPVDEEERLFQFGTSDIVACTKELGKAGVYAILVDSRDPANAAGTGGVADVAFFCAVKESTDCTLMLGGGITPENCSDVIAKDRPDIIDVMTGVEAVPGEKMPSRITALLKNGMSMLI